MSEIKRYQPYLLRDYGLDFAEMGHEPDGEYIRYYDPAAELAAKNEEIERLNNRLV